MSAYIDPILEDWASNNLLSYGIILMILSSFKMLFHLATIGLNSYFRDVLRQKTCVPDSVSAFKAFIDTFTVFVSSLFAIMGSSVPVTSFITLSLYLVMTPLQAVLQISICMKWMLHDVKHPVYPLIETSLDLPMSIVQILGFSVAIPLFYREYLIFKANYDIK
uniref:Uncharacterized protein n=1 Tax=Tetranychus urticae TaxID=32264 RepID=T1K305_TETUR